MSTVEVKPNKIKPLNTRMLIIAAVLLIVLALLFLATPLLRTSPGFQGRGNYVTRFNGQSSGGQYVFPGQGNGSQNPSGQNVVPGQGNGFQNPGGSNFPNRQFTAGRTGLLGFGLLNGTTGTIVYAVALLVALAAALGMFLAKRWGQVLGIVMAVIYGLFALVSLVPMLLLGSLSFRNPLTLIMGAVHLLLAIAVIVLASLPAKKVASVASLPPTAPAA
jgi:hypothetical protein